MIFEYTGQLFEVLKKNEQCYIYTSAQRDTNNNK